MLVAGAAAQIAFQPVADLLLGGVGMVRQQLARRQNHPRRTKSALQRVLIPERLLQRIQLSVLRQSFDRQDLAPLGLDGEHRTALDGHAVEHDGAGPADGGLAADVRPGEPGDFPQIVYEQQARLYFVRMALAVDSESDLLCHRAHPGTRIGPSPVHKTLSEKGVSSHTITRERQTQSDRLLGILYAISLSKFRRARLWI